MDVSSASLRVLCQIAESGSFTAAAAALGYTQSAVSRQAVALERSAGATLFERRTDGVRLTQPRTHAAAPLVIGAVAGLLPALRAARMSPTQAL